MRREFTPEFKRDAVRLVQQAKTLTEVAQDLGIARSLLQYWRKQLEDNQDSFPGRGNAPRRPCALKDPNRNDDSKAGGASMRYLTIVLGMAVLSVASYAEEQPNPEVKEEKCAIACLPQFLSARERHECRKRCVAKTGKEYDLEIALGNCSAMFSRRECLGMLRR